MQCRPQYQQQHLLQNHFQWCQTVLTLPVSLRQGRTAIAACPLQLRGSPAEFESQTWIDEQGLVMFHYMKRRTNKRLNSTSYCTWRRPSTAQRWPPPPPSRRPPPAHKEFQSPFHNCDIRWLHHHRGQIPTLVLVRMFGVLCCYCLVWWCQDIWWEVQSAWEDLVIPSGLEKFACDMI